MLNTAPKPAFIAYVQPAYHAGPRVSNWSPTLTLLHFPENIKAGLRYAYRLDYHNARLQPFLAFTF
jgi:hypothetical protein